MPRLYDVCVRRSVFVCMNVCVCVHMSGCLCVLIEIKSQDGVFDGPI